MNKAILSCHGVSKVYNDSTSAIDVLSDIQFTVQQGERVAITGPSGSGKSTLLHLLGGLDQPTQGDVFINNQAWRRLQEKQRCQLRNQYLGFVYQFHHLLPEFTALENVAMPLLLAGISPAEAAQRAEEMLTAVGLAARFQHKPAHLSGGERQRVAIARALIHKPHCVLADEPTGNLDQQTASHVFERMLNLNQQFNTALVIVTHDQKLAQRMDRVMVLSSGQLMVSNR